MTFSVSAAKPMTSRGRPLLRCAIVARMSGFSTSASVGAPPALLLDLLLAFGCVDAPVGDGGGEHRDIGRQAPARPRRSISRAVSTLTTVTPGGSGTFDRPGHQRHVGAGGRRRRGDGVALLAGRAVGDVAHRIDRLVRRARRDEHALARERPRSPACASMASAAATISSGSAMRPTPASPRSAISPAFGPTTRDAVGDELREIALRRRMLPHARVHRRRDQHRPVGREQHGGGEIVGMAAAPSSPSGRRSPARPRSDRSRAPAGYGRRRIRSRDRTGR